MDIILSFLAKPVDKHGVTPVHIIYPPLVVSQGIVQTPRTDKKENLNKMPEKDESAGNWIC